MTPQEELAELKRKLKAREGKQGYQGSVAELKKRIAELEGVNG